MGNPRRFFGADEEIEIGDVIIPARCAVEVTFRTHQQHFLLRPDEQANEIILGCFGRAYHRYPELCLNILSVLSDHGSFIALPASAFVLSSFMRDFLSTSATRLNGHRDRDGTFWERRYRAIPIVDEVAYEDRFRYVLTQGTKENLVWSAGDWPGITCAKALLGGKPLIGRWQDKTAEGIVRRQWERKLERARASGRVLDAPELPAVFREYPIELVPMPHWQELEVGQRRARVAAMLADDDDITRARHEQDGTAPLGVKAIRATDPSARSATPAKSPAPACHASTRAGRDAYRVAYRAFVEVMDAGRDAMKRRLPRIGVPLGGTLPPLSHHAPLPPRRPDPPLVIGDVTTPGAPAVGPPALG